MAIAESLGENVHHSFEATELRKQQQNLHKNLIVAKLLHSHLLNEKDADANYFSTGMIGSVSAVIPKAGTYDYSQIQAYISKNTVGGEIVKEKCRKF